MVDNLEHPINAETEMTKRFFGFNDSKDTQSSNTLILIILIVGSNVIGAKETHISKTTLPNVMVLCEYY